MGMPKSNNRIEEEATRRRGSGRGLLALLTCRRCETLIAHSHFEGVDDSVHVMLTHDRKRQKEKGIKPHGYVPRAPHPLLDKHYAEQQEEEAVSDAASAVESGATKGGTEPVMEGSTAAKRQ